MGGLSQEFLKQGVVNRECWTGIGVPRKPAPLPAHWDATKSCDEVDHLAWLTRTIETEIIPRLLLAHRMAPNARSVEAHDAGRKEMEEVAEFTDIILNQEVAAASRFIDSMRSQGVALETIYLDLLAPAARRLGDFWVADLSDFTEVTVGLWRLQRILHELSPAFHQGEAQGEDSPAHGRRVLLIPVPGEQHTLGLFMVGEFFRRAGWDVWGEPPGARQGVMGIVRTEWFDVVGLSAGCDSCVELMASVIADIRKASRNKSVAVMVGGPLFVAHPEYVETVGADATGGDANEAIRQAENIAALRVAALRERPC